MPSQFAGALAINVPPFALGMYDFCVAPFLLGTLLHNITPHMLKQLPYVAPLILSVAHREFGKILLSTTRQQILLTSLKHQLQTFNRLISLSI
jgi:hypothetical protein